MISADVKADRKQQETKELVAVSIMYFLKEASSKLEIQCTKQAYIFHLILLEIPSSSVLSIKNRGGGRGWGNFYSTDKIR